MLRETPRPLNGRIGPALQVYWKTGTSSGHRNGWAVGIFGPFVLAVWIGEFHNKEHTAFIGSKDAAPLFFYLIDAIHNHLGEKLPNVVKVTPEMNLVKVKVCEASGKLPHKFCPHLVNTWFIPGKSPIERDTIHREIAAQNSSFGYWPSDVQKIYSDIGLKLCFPPSAHEMSGEGDPPKILSPKQDIVYAVQLNKNDLSIPFLASVDADVDEIYWFVDDEYVGKTGQDKPLFWKAKAGAFHVRVVDNQGRSSAQKLTVETVEF